LKINNLIKINQNKIIVKLGLFFNVIFIKHITNKVYYVYIKYKNRFKMKNYNKKVLNQINLIVLKIYSPSI